MTDTRSALDGEYELLKKQNAGLQNQLNQSLQELALQVGSEDYSFASCTRWV
jgi:hypothetical protein